MIAALSGKLVSTTGDRVVLATAGGVSYEIAVPLGVLERLPRKGRLVDLETVLIVREDGWALYGFDQARERTVFQKLIGVTGIGPRLALAIVSTLGGNRVIRVLTQGDVAALCTVPGVGKKTAARIALELKDKLRDVSDSETAEPASLPTEQAIQALINLGYASNDADRAVRTVVAQNGSDEAVDLIRGALQLLGKGK